jgi:hypothetical protein
MNMKLAVQIVRFVDKHQPGWVECEFVDAQEQRPPLLTRCRVLPPCPLMPTVATLSRGKSAVKSCLDHRTRPDRMILSQPKDYPSS